MSNRLRWIVVSALFAAIVVAVGAVVGIRFWLVPYLRQVVPTTPEYDRNVLPLIPAELVWNEDEEKRSAADREQHLRKMAAIEETYIPILAKMPNTIAKTRPKVFVAHLPDEPDIRPKGVPKALPNYRTSAFSPTEPLLAVPIGSAVELFDLTQAKPKLRINIEDDRRGVRFSPNGRWLICDSGDDAAEIIDVAAGRVASKISVRGELLAQRRIAGIGFSQDGDTLLVAVAEDVDVRGQLSLLRWELPTGRLLETRILGKALRVPDSVAFSPDGQRMAGAIVTPVDQEGTGELLLIRTVDGAALLRRPFSNRGARLRFSPDGRHVAIDATGVRRNDTGLYDWNLKENRVDPVFVGDFRPADIVYSADNKLLFLHEPPRVWDVEAAKLLGTARIPDLAVHSVSPGGRLLITRGRILWDTAKITFKEP